MKITERHIFTFEVEAESREAAVEQLKREFSEESLEPEAPIHESGLNGMQIMLLDDLVKAINPDSVNLSADVRLLTDLDMNAKNFKKIIPLLEAKKNG